MPLKPRVRSHGGLFLLFFLLFLPAGLLFLIFSPNPLTDSLVSRACTAYFGRPLEFRGVQCEFPIRGNLVFRVREVDLGPMWRGADSAAARFILKHDLAGWLKVKDSRWVLKSRSGTVYLRLLSASAGEVLIKGGLCLDSGRITRWNAALRLPASLSERFPQIVEKRFAQDVLGRRLFKMTWADGRWRLWGRSGPVLEAKWR